MKQAETEIEEVSAAEHSGSAKLESDEGHSIFKKYTCCTTHNTQDTAYVRRDNPAIVYIDEDCEEETPLFAYFNKKSDQSVDSPFNASVCTEDMQEHDRSRIRSTQSVLELNAASNNNHEHIPERKEEDDDILGLNDALQHLHQFEQWPGCPPKKHRKRSKLRQGKEKIIFFFKGE